MLCSDLSRDEVVSTSRKKQTMETAAETFDERALWYHGLYGGLVGGTAALALFWIAGATWTRDIPGTEWARLIAAVVLGARASEPTALVVTVGIVLHFLVAAGLGVLYATIARVVPRLTRPPVSAISGFLFGALVWYVLANVVVPIAGVPNVVPLWEGLLVSVLGYGFAVSEVVSVLRPRSPIA
jgi:hypothetical protein